jgi:hypothetical protein
MRRIYREMNLRFVWWMGDIVRALPQFIGPASLFSYSSIRRT